MYFVAGDNLPGILATCVDENGNTLDLTTASSVTLFWRAPNGTPAARLMAVASTDPPAGVLAVTVEFAASGMPLAAMGEEVNGTAFYVFADGELILGEMAVEVEVINASSQRLTQKLPDQLQIRSRTYGPENNRPIPS